MTENIFTDIVDDALTDFYHSLLSNGGKNDTDRKNKEHQSAAYVKHLIVFVRNRLVKHFLRYIRSKQGKYAAYGAQKEGKYHFSRIRFNVRARTEQMMVVKRCFKDLVFFVCISSCHLNHLLTCLKFYKLVIISLLLDKLLVSSLFGYDTVF